MHALHTDFQAANQESVLRAIRCGISIVNTAKLIGISRRTIYNWRDRDSDFAARLAAAIEKGQTDPDEPEECHRRIPPDRPPRPVYTESDCAESQILQGRASYARSGSNTIRAGERDEDTDEDEAVVPEVVQPRPRPRRRTMSTRELRRTLHPDLDVASLDAGPPLPELIEWYWDVARGVIDAPDSLRSTAARVLAKVKFDPLLHEAKVQSMLRARRQERIEDAQDVTDAGLVILEIPANGTEAPGHAPRQPDEAVIDAEVAE